MVTVIQKAERLPNGRVKGVGPPRLWPKVVRTLTAQEMGQLQDMQQQVRALQRKQLTLFAGLGLDPRRRYRLTIQGEVIEIGKHVPEY